MTEEITYGYGTISFSLELLQRMITKGWHAEGLKCIEGLPESAEFQRVYADANTDIVFVFRIPEVEDHRLYVPDKYLPRLEVAWVQHYSEDTTIEFPDGKKIIVHHHDRLSPIFSSNTEGVIANPSRYIQIEPLEYEVEVLT